MAIATNHVDRMLPWLLEVIEAYALLDEVGWSLDQQMTPAGPEGQYALRWHLMLSTKNPLLGQGDLVASMLLDDMFPVEFTFKSVVVEMLNVLAQSRQTILSGTGMTDPSGNPLS